MSYASYCSRGEPTDLLNWDCFFCNKTFTRTNVVEKIFSDDAHNLFGYVVRTEYDIVISFRGSQQSLENWITNLNFLKTDYEYGPCGCKVHSGFYQGYMYLKDQIVPTIRSLKSKYPNLPVRVTGHSLGAALATHCVADLMGVEKIPVDMLIHYGEPRVGDSGFSQWFRNLGVVTTRVTHYKDIVPHLPPKDFGFWHVPKEIWFTDDTSYRVCDGSGEDPTCSDSVLGDSIADHLTYLGVDLRNGGANGC